MKANSGCSYRGSQKSPEERVAGAFPLASHNRGNVFAAGRRFYNRFQRLGLLRRANRAARLEDGRELTCMFTGRRPVVEKWIREVQVWDGVPKAEYWRT